LNYRQGRFAQYWHPLKLGKLGIGFCLLLFIQIASLAFGQWRELHAFNFILHA
jgi:hypothetical protein